MRLGGTGVCYSETEHPVFKGDRDKYNPDKIARNKYKDLNLNPVVSNCTICNSVPEVECRILPKKVVWYEQHDMMYSSDGYKRESSESYFHIFCKNCKTELRSANNNFRKYSTTVNKISHALSIHGWNGGDVFIPDSANQFRDVIRDDIARMSDYQKRGFIHPNCKSFHSPIPEMPYASNSYSDDNFYYSFNVFTQYKDCKVLAIGGIVTVESCKTGNKSYYVFKDSPSLRKESYQNLDAYVCDCFNYIKYKHEFIKPVCVFINNKTQKIVKDTDELILWKRRVFSQIDIGSDKFYFNNWVTAKTSDEKIKFQKENRLKNKEKKCPNCSGMMKLVNDFKNYQCLNCCFTEV